MMDVVISHRGKGATVDKMEPFIPFTRFIERFLFVLRAGAGTPLWDGATNCLAVSSIAGRYD